MKSGQAQRAKDLVEQAIPDLLVGPGATQSSAIHKIDFIGPLDVWDDFEKDVMAAYDQHDWHKHRTTLAHRPSGPLGPNNTATEHVHTGDEHGVQGRFQQNIGQIMTAIFKSQGMQLSFGDFKCASEDYENTPDAAGVDNAGALIFVGELKVPWVKAHFLRELISDEKRFRRILGQW